MPHSFIFYLIFTTDSPIVQPTKILKHCCLSNTISKKLRSRPSKNLGGLACTKVVAAGLNHLRRHDAKYRRFRCGTLVSERHQCRGDARIQDRSLLSFGFLNFPGATRFRQSHASMAFVSTGRYVPCVWTSQAYKKGAIRNDLYGAGSRSEAFNAIFQP
jgi:hypothetical protein